MTQSGLETWSSGRRQQELPGRRRVSGPLWWCFCKLCSRIPRPVMNINNTINIIEYQEIERHPSNCNHHYQRWQQAPQPRLSLCSRLQKIYSQQHKHFFIWRGVHLRKKKEQIACNNLIIAAIAISYPACTSALAPYGYAVRAMSESMIQFRSLSVPRKATTMVVLVGRTPT